MSERNSDLPMTAEHNFQLALKTLEANLRIREQELKLKEDAARQHFKLTRLLFCVFFGLFFAFGFYALSLGEEDFLADGLKILMGAFGGGGLGFWAGHKKGRESKGN